MLLYIAFIFIYIYFSTSSFLHLSFPYLTLSNISLRVQIIIYHLGCWHNVYSFQFSLYFPFLNKAVVSMINFVCLSVCLFSIFQHIFCINPCLFYSFIFFIPVFQSLSLFASLFGAVLWRLFYCSNLFFSFSFCSFPNFKVYYLLTETVPTSKRYRFSSGQLVGIIIDYEIKGQV